jgi:hypothetical protein
MNDKKDNINVNSRWYILIRDMFDIWKFEVEFEWDLNWEIRNNERKKKEKNTPYNKYIYIYTRIISIYVGIYIFTLSFLCGIHQQKFKFKCKKFGILEGKMKQGI